MIISMQLTTTLISALALTTPALAAPLQTIPTAALVTQVAAIQYTILNLIEDMITGNTLFKHGYQNGATEFADLGNTLQGPQECSPFLPGQPSSNVEVIQTFQQAQLGLNMVSLDLLNPAKKVENSDFHADVCSAWDYYDSIAKFAGVD